jgi:hypothetical protein
MPLNALGKQGRYVRIQLLDKGYLSLAEVQVMGGSVDSLPHSVIEPSTLRAAKAFSLEIFGALYHPPKLL